MRTSSQHQKLYRSYTGLSWTRSVAITISRQTLLRTHTETYATRPCLQPSSNITSRPLLLDLVRNATTPHNIATCIRYSWLNVHASVRVPVYIMQPSIKAVPHLIKPDQRFWALHTAHSISRICRRWNRLCNSISHHIKLVHKWIMQATVYLVIVRSEDQVSSNLHCCDAVTDTVTVALSVRDKTRPSLFNSTTR